jgi:hypothetical protein
MLATNQFPNRPVCCTLPNCKSLNYRHLQSGVDHPPLDDSVFETATIQTFVGAKEEQEIKGIFKSDLGSNLNYQALSEINHDYRSL